MDALRDIVLVIFVLGVFAFGYFIMARLDKFLCDNRKYFDNADKAEEPSFVILTGDTPDEEILEEVRKYREKHKNVCVAIYDRSPADNSESVKYQSDQK